MFILTLFAINVSFLQQYIYEAINAGRELLGICINELYPEDALQYLPSRYLLWFQYAAVFLLKVSEEHNL